MGLRGPTPKPIAWHKQNGTYRKDRHGVCHLPCEIPPCPDNLSGPAREFFQHVAADAFRAGTITKVDGIYLMLISHSWATYVNCQRLIREQGFLIETHTSRGTVLRPHPAVRIRNQVLQQIDRGLRQFGLTPASRIRLEKR